MTCVPRMLLRQRSQNQRPQNFDVSVRFVLWIKRTYIFGFDLDDDTKTCGHLRNQYWLIVVLWWCMSLATYTIGTSDMICRGTSGKTYFPAFYDGKLTLSFAESHNLRDERESCRCRLFVAIQHTHTPAGSIKSTKFWNAGLGSCSEALYNSTLHVI